MKRKFTGLLLALGFSYASFCQWNYGFKIGLTQSKIQERPSGSYTDMNFKSGLQFGAFFNFALVKNLYVRPALQLTQKGYEAVEGKAQGPAYWYRNWSFTYLELPVDFVYTIPISKTVNLYVGTGPVLGLGLFGKSKGIAVSTDGAGQRYRQEGTGHQPFGKTTYKRIDVGADFLTGVQIKRFMLTASYNHGLVNVLHRDQSPQFTKNRSFALTIGYIVRKR